MLTHEGVEVGPEHVGQQAIIREAGGGDEGEEEAEEVAVYDELVLDGEGELLEWSSSDDGEDARHVDG